MSDAICSAADCGNQANAKRGLCWPHYDRARRGPGLPPRWPALTFEVTPHAATAYTPIHCQQFWAKVDAEGDCWQWTGAINWRGYGLATMTDSMKPAHRAAWIMLVGPIPDGMQLDHRCFNTACVNPDHLQVVPPVVNSARRRSNPLASRTSCKRGHPYTPENTAYRKQGGRKSRVCRACALEHRAERRRREAN